MQENKWNLFSNTLEGPSLILGPGFDYDCMILLDSDKKNLIIRARQPSRADDENYPYDTLMEYCVSLDDLQKVISPEKV